MNYADLELADNPIAYYPLNEASGPIAYDLTGKNNAAYSGSVTYGIAGPNGDTGITLNSGAQLILPASLGIPTFAALTIVVWVKTSLDSDWHPVGLTCDGFTSTLYVDGDVSAGSKGATVTFNGLFDYLSTADNSSFMRLGIFNKMLPPAAFAYRFQAGGGIRETIMHGPGFVPGVPRGWANVLLDSQGQSVVRTTSIAGG